MSSKRYPYLTQQLPVQTTAALRNPRSLPEEVDLRTLSSNPLVTRVVPKPGGASQLVESLDQINRVQDELVKRRERFEKRDAARRRLSDENRRKTAQMEVDNIKAQLGSDRVAVEALVDPERERVAVRLEEGDPTRTTRTRIRGRSAR